MTLIDMHKLMIANNYDKLDTTIVKSVKKVAEETVSDAVTDLNVAPDTTI